MFKEKTTYVTHRGASKTLKALYVVKESLYIVNGLILLIASMHGFNGPILDKIEQTAPILFAFPFIGLFIAWVLGLVIKFLNWWDHGGIPKKHLKLF